MWAWRRRGAVAAAALAAAVVVAGCGSSGRSAEVGGSLSIVYPASMSAYMSAVVPAFGRARGVHVDYHVEGPLPAERLLRSGGQIPGVFFSDSSTVDASLEVPAGSNPVSWFATLGSSPLVLACKPKSTLAAAANWVSGVDGSHLQVGRANPAIDPEGTLALQALDQTAAVRHAPQLLAASANVADILTPPAMVQQIRSGKLAGGFMFDNEARAAGLDGLSLAPLRFDAQYTATIPARGADQKQAVAFIEFLLSGPGRSLAEEASFPLSPSPAVSGQPATVPAGLRAALHAG